MKPDLALVNLNRREPIVYFGCTWTEIKASIWRAASVVLPVTVVLMAVLPAPIFMLIPGMLGWVALSRLFMGHINRNRAGKPLFYERHKKLSKHSTFIRAGRMYQFARNTPRSSRSSRVSRAPRAFTPAPRAPHRP